MTRFLLWRNVGLPHITVEDHPENGPDGSRLVACRVCGERRWTFPPRYQEFVKRHRHQQPSQGKWME